MVAPSFRIIPAWTFRQQRQNIYMSVFVLLVRARGPSWSETSFTYLIPGQSVYWQSMFQKSQDPTLVLLTFIWHAMYAWDEALENLYEHICSLVSWVSCGWSSAFWLADRKAAWSQLRKCHLPKNFMSSELIIFITYLSLITIQSTLISSKRHPTPLWLP